MNKIKQALARLTSAIEEHKPIAVFGLFSGGHDSFTASYIASQHPAFTSIVHINTGIGIPLTRDYVYKTVQTRKWPFLEYKATKNVQADGTPDPQIYADIVRKYGFPGIVLHTRHPAE